MAAASQDHVVGFDSVRRPMTGGRSPSDARRRTPGFFRPELKRQRPCYGAVICRCLQSLNLVGLRTEVISPECSNVMSGKAREPGAG